MTETFVVVGAGVAGATAARTLRSEGFAGRIVLVGDEHCLPYRRPALSKDLLAGTTTPERTLLAPAAFWAEQRIDVRTGVRAVALDVDRRRICLSDGAHLDYDALLLATGARARRVDPDPAPDRAGRIHTLRTLRDLAPLRDAVERTGSLLVVGAGLLGCEVAATARTLGADVTVLAAGPAPLGRVAPPQVTEMYRQLHLQQGVRLHTNVPSAGPTDTGSEVVATSADGRTWTAATALVSLGAVPDTELALAAGLAVDDGIVVDEHFRTSAPRVYAAGDVADRPDARLGGRHRSRHWNDARAQGTDAARSMLGHPPTAAAVPWGWSDQYGHNLQFAGWARPDDEFVVRGSIPRRDFTALGIRDGRLVGALALGRPRDIRAVRQLLAGGPLAAPATLTDETTDLTELTRGLARLG